MTVALITGLHKRPQGWGGIGTSGLMDCRAKCLAAIGQWFKQISSATSKKPRRKPVPSRKRNQLVSRFS
jgi:hypothetical protein